MSYTRFAVFFDQNEKTVKIGERFTLYHTFRLAAVWNSLKDVCDATIFYSLKLSDRRLRPYHVEYTRSRLISEVKQRRARLVLAWVTGWEYRVP